MTVEDNRAVHIGPDKENLLSWRDFCVKGRTAAELVEHPRRIMSPMRRVGDRYVEASYDEAFAEIAAALHGIIGRGGPDSVGAYYGNPAGFNSAEIPALSRFMGSLGSSSLFNWGSIDTNAKTVVCGEMYGVNLLPMIPDVDDCDCVLFVGMNPAESKMCWLSSVPDGWRRIKQRVTSGAALLVLDPYRTATAKAATSHWQLRPGEDWAFLLGMLKVIFDEELEDQEACDAEHGVGLLRHLVSEASLDLLAARAGVSPAAIETAGRQFGQARTAMALARTGVSQTSRGTLALWLCEVLNIVTGRWDRPGGRYFQRGYAPVHMAPYDTDAHVSRVAGRPAIEGCHSLAELPGEIQTPGRGQVRALFIDHGNPVISGPQGDELDQALGSLDLLVAIDMVQRESHRHADWLIPGTHWLERGELAPYAAVTQELPFAQYATQALEPPPKVKPEWHFYEGLGRAMGLPKYGPDDRPFNPERAWRQAVERGGRTTWEELLAHPHGIILGDKEFGHARGIVNLPDHRIQLAPGRFLAEARRQLACEVVTTPRDRPFQLGNRRRLSSMNSYLNDLPGTRRLIDRNQLEINEDDAAALGLKGGDRARVRSLAGAIELDVVVTDSPRPGVVVVEHGWGSRVFDPSGGVLPDQQGANRNLLTALDEED
ncbi:MAG: molybdopterin-containing oxidoreductase family protein, partial [Mycobacterium sp.]